MKLILCDFCKKEACHSVEICTGFTTESGTIGHMKKYKPFEKPLAPEKRDMCEKHYKIWCRATYEALYRKVKG